MIMTPTNTNTTTIPTIPTTPTTTPPTTTSSTLHLSFLLHIATSNSWRGHHRSSTCDATDPGNRLRKSCNKG